MIEMNNAKRSSPVWRELVDHLKERREQLRSQLEGDKNFEETLSLRARIAEIKGLLALDESSPILMD